MGFRASCERAQFEQVTLRVGEWENKDYFYYDKLLTKDRIFGGEKLNKKLVKWPQNLSGINKLC